MSTDFRIVTLPGDGIGVEVMNAGLEVLEVLQQRMGGYRLRFEHHPGGAQDYADTGVTFPDSSMRASTDPQAVLFGGMGLPHGRYPDGTENAPQRRALRACTPRLFCGFSRIPC